MIDLRIYAVNYLEIILSQIFPVHLSYICGMGFVITFFLMVGKYLSNNVKPDAPYLSRMLRSIGFVVHWTGIVFLWVAIFVIFGFYSSLYIGEETAIPYSMIVNLIALSFLLGVAPGFLMSLIFNWRIIPEWSNPEKVTDAEQILSKLKKLKSYNPLKYVDLRKGCFLGLSYPTRKPIYASWEKINESHIQCLGASSSGKNIAMLLVVHQCVQSGQGVVWVDPKEDFRTPTVLQNAAEIAGKKFHYINLKLEQPPQFNLIAGCSASEIYELFYEGFDLQDKGDIADVHRGKDEDAAMLAAEMAIKEKAMSIPELLQLCSNITSITKQDNFWRRFNKLASMSVIQTAKGINLEEAILRGDILYFIGDTEGGRVKMLQKMLLLRTLQIIKKRDRFSDNKAICVVLDEFKHVLTQTALNGIAVIRDFKAHFMLAHQSMGDLAQVPNVSYDAAFGAVVDNTTLKMITKIGDVDYAKKLSELAGTKKVFRENTSKSSSDANVNNIAEGSWIEDRDFRIPSEVITGLPMPKDRVRQAVVGVLFGVDEAQFFYSAPINVKPVKLSVVVAPHLPVSYVVNDAGDLI